MAVSTQAINSRVHTQSQALANLLSAQSSGKITRLEKDQGSFLKSQNAVGHSFLNSLQMAGHRHDPSTSSTVKKTANPNFTPKIFYGSDGKPLHGAERVLASFQSRLPWLARKADKSGDSHEAHFLQSLEY